MLSEYRAEISELKQNHAHFSKIFNDHNMLDQEIQDAVEGRVSMSGIEIEIMKKKKLKLKDEMLRMILKLKKEKV
jgi:uncharacterized protein YdcH (DUF465 family)